MHRISKVLSSKVTLRFWQLCFAAGLLSLASYGTSYAGQTASDNSNYEVILYDLDTIDKINTPPPVQAIPTIATTPTYPRDISSQITETIAGVPIIENPKNCASDPLTVKITVENVKNSKGIIVADLHDDMKENFLVWDKVVLRIRQPAQEGETHFCMPLTRPGEYAIAVYHDKNGNREFDKNFLGIPKEHFGMSNNPKFGLSAPEYEETAFSVPATGSEIRIKLHKASDIL